MLTKPNLRSIYYHPNKSKSRTQYNARMHSRRVCTIICVYVHQKKKQQVTSNRKTQTKTKRARMIKAILSLSLDSLPYGFRVQLTLIAPASARVTRLRGIVIFVKAHASDHIWGFGGIKKTRSITVCLVHWPIYCARVVWGWRRKIFGRNAKRSFYRLVDWAQKKEAE